MGWKASPTQVFLNCVLQETLGHFTLILTYDEKLDTWSGRFHRSGFSGNATALSGC